MNHTESLGLNEKRITAAPVLRHYGIEPAGDPTVFRTGDGDLMAQWDGQLIFNAGIVEFAPEGVSLIGAGRVSVNEFAFVFPALIIVCDGTGGLIDRLDEASLPPGRIRGAGTSEGKLVIEVGSGERFGLKDWIEAIPHAGEMLNVYKPAPKISGDERETLATAFRGEGLPLSRIVLDLHSGRFFGTIGVILYDLAAITLFALGITGTLLWFRRR